MRSKPAQGRSSRNSTCALCPRTPGAPPAGQEAACLGELLRGQDSRFPETTDSESSTHPLPQPPSSAPITFSTLLPVAVFEAALSHKIVRRSICRAHQTQALRPMLPVWKYLWGVTRDGEAGGEQRNGGKPLRQAELSSDISPELPDVSLVHGHSMSVTEATKGSKSASQARRAHPEHGASRSSSSGIPCIDFLVPFHLFFFWFVLLFVLFFLALGGGGFV